jgi:hypothetical protein
MSLRACPVMIEITPDNRHPAGVKVPPRAEPAEVSLALREKGWTPYRIWFDASESAWIAAVIYRSGAN